MKTVFGKSAIKGVLLSAFALALAGCEEECDATDPTCNCNDLNGGGWVSSDAGDKVNLGFQLQCSVDDEGVRHVSGQFQINDPSNGTRFHGVAFETPLDPGIDMFQGRYTGEYAPQPYNAGAGGDFEVLLIDNGRGGAADELELTLSGGMYDGYTISGTLSGGNMSHRK